MGPVTSGGDRLTQRLELLDYLRFLAATSVVAFHYLYNGMENGKLTSLEPSALAGPARFGLFGVELFFMISGFVILGSARGRSARQFVVGRALRLLPAFWVAMALTAVVMALWGDASGLRVTAGQVLGNLTMTPTLFGVEPVDGVYWTLLLELQFYALVLLFLVLGQGHRLGAFLPYWALAIWLVNYLVPALADRVWLGDHFAFFVAGALIAEIRYAGVSPLRLGGLVATAAVTVPYAAWIASWLMPGPSGTVACMLLVVAFYAVLLSLCLPSVAAVRLPASAWAGGLTYPLYLLHAHIGYILLSRFGEESHPWTSYGVVLAVVLTLTVAVHVLVERRGRPFWHSLFDRSLGRLADVLDRTRRQAPSYGVGGRDVPTVPAGADRM